MRRVGHVRSAAALRVLGFGRPPLGSLRRLVEKTHQLGNERRAIGIAVSRFAGQALQQALLGGSDDGRGQRAGTRRRLRRRLHDDGHRRVPLKRRPAAEHLVDGGREGVLVRASVVVFAQHDFGSHIPACPRRDPLLSQPAGGWPAGFSPAALGDPEIPHISVAAAVEQNIVRLDVAMNITLRVDEIEGFRDIRQPTGQSGRIVRRRLAVGPDGLPVFQIASGQIVHDREWDAVFIADVHHLHDVRMGQRDERPDFLPKRFTNSSSSSMERCGTLTTTSVLRLRSCARRPSPSRPRRAASGRCIARKVLFRANRSRLSTW